MKKLVPLLALLAGVIFVGRSFLTPKASGAFDIDSFSRLPVLANGRIKPLDTVARTSLLQLQGRQRVSTPEQSQPFVASPAEWLLDVTFRPEKADAYPTFAIDNPELLALVGKNEDALRINYPDATKRVLAVVGFLPSTHRRFSFNELKPHFLALDEQAKLAGQVEATLRTPFQRGLLQLYTNLIDYQRLRYAFVMPSRDDFISELIRFQDQLPTGVEAVRAKQAGKPADEATVSAMTEMGRQFMTMSEASNLLTIPAADGDPTGWRTTGAALLASFQTGDVDPHALAYAGLSKAWRAQNPEQFNQLLTLMHVDLQKRYSPQLKKSAAETQFNSAEPFYSSMSLYAVAFLVAIASWLIWPELLGRSAYYLVILAWALSTVGISARMWLESRPPVTNLYSSALFIGWGAVALCLVLEFLYRNAIGSVTAGVIGFGTLLIAHHLSLGGDTLEMMRAVLDSNFWLGTHVVTVTIGYSATFLAGFLALIYVIRGVFTRSLDSKTADALARMVYGIVCFATLFSFIGTVLGGIWADQSWGRFWGWDPKENGALIIVVWNALILHARWGGMIKQRGLMCLAIFGNIITSWSWFGTNMLGVGLHSYGFTDAAFVALSVFVVTQLVFIAVANLPLVKWRSFSDRLPAAAASASGAN